MTVPEWIAVALFGALLTLIGVVTLAGVKQRDALRDFTLLLNGNGKSKGFLARAEEKFDQFDRMLNRFDRVAATVESIERHATERENAQNQRFASLETELRRLFHELDVRERRRKPNL